MVKQVSRRVVLIGSALLMAGLPAAARAGTGYAQTFANRNASGEALATAFFELLQAAGGKPPAEAQATVKPYLDPAFQLQRASGKRYTADNYVPAAVEAFSIGDARESQPAAGVMVVRYSVRARETAPDTALVMAADKAPRITVFRWSDAASHWQVVSHANFNTPVAAICDKTPVITDPPSPTASPADEELAKEIVGRFIKLLEAGDAAPALDPNIQVQAASGAGYTTLAERTTRSKAVGMSYSKPLVTRSGRILVFSAYFITESHSFTTEPQLRVGEVPHLLTFHEAADGQWKMIANALFSPPPKLPEGKSCAPQGELAKAP